MEPSINDERSVSVVEPHDSARRMVLESPELVDVIIQHCTPEDTVRMSLVNRLFEAATAPTMYRKVTLSASGWKYDLSFWSCFEHKITNTRQNKYLSYARALYLEAEPIDYDLSSYSFARVEVVEHLPCKSRYYRYERREVKYKNDKKRAKVIGENMAKLLDLRPSTVIDMDCRTIPVYNARPDDEESEEESDSEDVSPSPPSPPSPLPDEEECPGMINRHATRLVTSPESLRHTLATRLEASTRFVPGKRNAPPQAFYPNLVEVVIRIDMPLCDSSLLKMALILVQHGYSVVLAGYQHQFQDKAIVRWLLWRTHKTTPIPNRDLLVDNLVDNVHNKMSLAEYRASPYGRYPQSTSELDRLIRLEERFHRDHRGMVRAGSRNQGRR